MKYTAHLAIAVTCMASLAFDEAAAQAFDRQASPGQFFLGRLQGGATLPRYLQSLRIELLRLDANGDGAIDAADADLHNAVSAVVYRSNAALVFMNADLDGDGFVTEAELQKKFEYDRRMTATGRPEQPDMNQITQEIRTLMAADADKDGRITWIEATEFVKKQTNYASGAESAYAMQVRQLLPLATDGKMSVSLPEIDAAATAVFASVDTDGNGTISQDELSTARSLSDRDLRKEQAHLDCGMPAASERSTVVLLGTYETDALSSVALGSQNDVTRAGTIVIEPGDDPIYLVVTSYGPTIWRFQGAVERIERVVVTTARTGLDGFDPKSPPLAGTTGLPAERVTFVRQSGCLGYFTAAPSIDEAKAASVVKQQARKEVAVVAAHQRTAGFRIPSGKVETTEMATRTKSGSVAKLERDIRNRGPQAATGDLERNFLQLTPGGLIEIEANSVVASAEVVPYEVPPQEAGLIQLMKSGALTQNQRGEFLIHSKIRLPTALSGRHAAKFLLMRGVPMPEGDLGQSLIVSEETGEAIPPRR